MNESMIIVTLEKLLEERGYTIYSFSKDHNIPYKTVWALCGTSPRPKAISFDVMSRINRALKCQPGDWLQETENPPKRVIVRRRGRRPQE